MNNLAAHLDLANHHANATPADVEKIAAAVKEHGFNSAFVNPCYIQLVKSLGVRVGTVVSFPLGQETLAMKTGSAQAYAALGADELDVSLNVGYLVSGKWTQSLVEMKAVIAAAREVNSKIIVKFIPECGYLSSDQIKKTAQLMVEAGADFFKTCSGTGPRGAMVEDVKLVREAVGEKIKIKVAGGVETAEQAMAFINAGADRIGTSHAVEIITGH
ncbi:MAG: deoxyribose-phosphate aldolase [Patescibacteria group bacterium]|nr:deoxyribose-phosphate aldolase [Patescibacteria group bacterium]MCL5431942.1 deoxyribose-phosphate aldolase [Patescibacteria group bacterium]